MIDMPRLKLAIVRILNWLCTVIDALAYRPAVVKLTERLPRFWTCQAAHASMALDRRWRTGFWTSADAPAVPGGPCDACGRRAALFTIGGWAEKTKNDIDRPYLADHVVQLCGWCCLDGNARPADRAELDRALATARSRSVAWRWR
jgi:hypothetical protein